MTWEFLNLFPSIAKYKRLALMKTHKTALDMCCGSKMFWFEKQNQGVVYGDMRNESHVLCDGRSLAINPDVRFDFTEMPFRDSTFKLVVFDPPHLVDLGKSSWMAKKYGILNKGWREEIHQGFQEGFRVLQEYGVLIFKWSEVQIKVSEVIKLSGKAPLFGHISGKAANVHWISFMKGQ